MALGHEPMGKRKAGRPRRSERDDVTVKMDRLIVSRAKFVASARGIPLAEYLSEMVRGSVDRDFAKEGKRLDVGEKEGGKSAPP